VGTFLPWLLGRLARRALTTRLPARVPARKPAPAHPVQEEPPQEEAFGEFIFFRRIVIRR